MSKNSRFQYQYRKSASKRHKEVGKILRTSSLFSGYETYQEYPVNKVNPDYKSGTEHFDWVIPQLKIVIEIHGIHHYKATSFGKDQDPTINLASIQRRDKDKADAAIQAGYTYIDIPPNDEISEEYLLAKYKEYFNPNPIKQEKVTEESEWIKKQKEFARAQRRQNYLRKKKIADKMKNGHQ